MHPNKNWVILFVPFEVFKHEYKLNLLRIQTKLGHPRATKKKKILEIDGLVQEREKSIQLQTEL